VTNRRKVSDIARRSLLAAGDASGAASTSPAVAQSPSEPARPGAAPADFILKNGKVTVDRRSR
jgi:hypothetical protein